MSMNYPSSLTDAEWAYVQQHLPSGTTCGRPRTHSLRDIFDASFRVLRTGCPWRYLPADCPQLQTVYYHCRRFRLQCTWHLLYTAIYCAERARVSRSPGPSGASMARRSRAHTAFGFVDAVSKARSEL
jgi:putative transposase